MFKLDFSCQECNPNRLEQVIDYIKKAWECEENDRYCDEFNSYYNSESIAVDTVFYWNGKNQKEIQNYIDKNNKTKNELIAIINHPEAEYDEYFPFSPYTGYCWKNICCGGFWIMEYDRSTQWITSFVVVENDSVIPKGNILRHLK